MKTEFVLLYEFRASKSDIRMPSKKDFKVLMTAMLQKVLRKGSFYVLIL